MTRASQNIEADRIRVGTVKVTKGPEALAGILREAILSGAFAPGAAFSSERALVEQTGLSRATIREALRILETEGLIVSRADLLCRPLGRRRFDRGGGQHAADRPGGDLRRQVTGPRRRWGPSAPMAG